MTRLRNVGVGISLDPATPPPNPHEISAILEKALRMVWQGHRDTEFNWYSWFETARTALTTYDTYGKPPKLNEPVPLPAPVQEIPRPADTWHEEYGEVLWWRFPICEAPYVGSPLADDWIEDHYTHWTPIPIPMEPVTP
jgi:hypothetical protein